MISTCLALPRLASVVGATMVTYGASKAALNYITATLAFNVKDVLFAAVHPGWVQTEMGGGDKAPVSKKDCVSGLRVLSSKLTKADSGHFFDNITGGEITA